LAMVCAVAGATTKRSAQRPSATCLVQLPCSLSGKISESTSRSESVPSVSGVMKRAASGVISTCMASLRTSPPDKLGRAKVTAVVDHWQPEDGVRRPIDEVSATEVAARNIVVFDIEGGRVTIRPSGTEPKLKFYVQTAPSHWTPDDAVALAREIYGQLLGILDMSLSPAAIDLPDVLPVATKLTFDADVGAVLERLRDTPPSEAVEQVRDAVDRLVPGGDALRTVESTVRAMAGAVDGIDADVRATFDSLVTAAVSNDG